jgi:hypothetical protein
MHERDDDEDDADEPEQLTRAPRPPEERKLGRRRDRGFCYFG